MAASEHYIHAAQIALLERGQNPTDIELTTRARELAGREWAEHVENILADKSRVSRTLRPL